MLTVLTLAAPPAMDGEQFDRIGSVVQAAVGAGEVPGAVVVVVHRDAVVYREAFGRRAIQPDAEAMTADTIFDLASLTKPVVTGTLVMKLVEQGKLRLDDPVAKHWPAFAAHGKSEVTIEDCLLHRSGLTPDNGMNDYVGSRDEMFERIAQLPLSYPTGTAFKYSDVGYIVLGRVVELVSKEPLNEVARREIFEPLKMTDAAFNPTKPEVTKRNRIAPTETRGGEPMRGSVHDPRAYALGGVAGHAGLFGTADDLARYCRMLLNEGTLDGKRVLSPASVRLFTEPVALPGDNLRSRGWDVATGYSALRGDVFAKGEGFGHTGFTGTSIWIDPASETAVILLTNRVHPNGRGNSTPLRRKIATIVGAAVSRR